ncbi:TIGR04283 family arsenosugar biosynthesis glycosyltransferase [Leptolyngbya sp. FACHB-16]|nr:MULTISPECIES: TIGR04283 family arsenosugar biosynthesis glycosyltransferase [unclassified Leptolyngbya]MBD1914237.1 TIGR04283 family arsenosugar biosynthesis glycosyltransferase [Leptolyngbya sp. FACHB-8]MBD2157244.1 TIGR04283 family arsenosugar biosynthesis glycosyltransferase [Leptolyngbya sp. FACHB-16]
MNHLAIFTRYPQPGSTKTRLIPALGPEGAAGVQRQMTEHTLRQVRCLQQRRDVTVTLHIAGGDEAAITAWLGLQWNHQPQKQGDLGDRLIAAMQSAFQSGASRLVIIGIDCPDINADVLEQALNGLEQADVVLGPATDGGYYLIGLRSPISELFQGVAWSTDQVFQQTQTIAQNLGLSVHTLAPLSDVDYPEDLPVWQAVQQQTLSVIVPVLNEAGNIRPLIEHLQETPEVEVILVDGGSTDGTVAIAQSLDVQLLSASAGRAHQMNVGANAASGGILLFLHADTRLPTGFVHAVRTTLTQPNVVVGAFELAIQGNHWGLRWIEWGVRWRSRLFQRPYGDQALFMRRETFERLGQFPEVALLEEFILMQRARRLGRVAIAPLAVLTSGRRWEKLGVWKTTLINQLIILGYYLGLSPQQLVRWYRDRHL